MGFLVGASDGFPVGARVGPLVGNFVVGDLVGT